MRPRFLWLVLITAALAGPMLPGAAAAEWLKQDWQAMVFAGPLSTNDVRGEILQGDVGFENAGIVGVGASKQLFRVWRDLTIEAEAQVVKHYGKQNHWEIVGAFIARWSNFWWDDTIDTTVAIGDGISHATEKPALERQRHEHSAKNLNYVLGEITLRLPDEPDWSISLRFHHRSGFFGHIDDVDEGSTVIALGVKFRL